MVVMLVRPFINAAAGDDDGDGGDADDDDDDDGDCGGGGGDDEDDDDDDDEADAHDEYCFLWLLESTTVCLSITINAICVCNTIVPLLPYT